MKLSLLLLVLIVGLIACSQTSRKADWISDALSSIQSKRYPRVKAVNYWHENWNNSSTDKAQLRLDSSPEALEAYKKGIADDIFLTKIKLSTNSLKILPSSSGVYHCAFPDFGGTEDSVTLKRITDFENLVAKNIAWVTFADNWVGGISFPKDEVELIWNSGHLPYIKMMAFSTHEYSNGGMDSIYDLVSIASGKFDDDLRKWADDAKESGVPMLVCFGVEVNGKWFPWNGKWNGGAAKGPSNFISAYRHVVDVFRQQGANNISWVYHVNATSNPDEPWNSIASYYPGDKYVDWIGVSVYGAQSNKEARQYWERFREIMDVAYPKLTALSANKPICVSEFGVTE